MKNEAKYINCEHVAAQSVQGYIVLQKALPNFNSIKVATAIWSTNLMLCSIFAIVLMCCSVLKCGTTCNKYALKNID